MGNETSLNYNDDLSNKIKRIDKQIKTLKKNLSNLIENENLIKDIRIKQISNNEITFNNKCLKIKDSKQNLITTLNKNIIFYYIYGK